MMNVNINNQMELRAAGMQVLLDSLGPVGFASFIQQFENGYGDYTKEKYLRPELTIDDLESELQKYIWVKVC